MSLTHLGKRGDFEDVATRNPRYFRYRGAEHIVAIAGPTSIKSVLMRLAALGAFMMLGRTRNGA